MSSLSALNIVKQTRLLLMSSCLVCALTGCHSLKNRGPTLTLDPETTHPVADRLVPSNNRDWKPDLAVLPYAEIDDNQVTVHNIRDCVYRSEDEYVIKHYDKTFELDRITGVDFVVVPFKETPSLAHTLLSFNFDDEDYVSVSVEARLEKGESYSSVLGAMRQFELMYVVADERDVLLRRSKYRGADVYLYHTRATPQQSRKLFLDVMERVNNLYKTPEFYDTVSNNCTTNIVWHINRLSPGKINLYDPRVLLPGYADRLAYELGLLDESKSFAQLREEARISDRANRYADRKDFSQLIRK